MGRGPEQLRIIPKPESRISAPVVPFESYRRTLWSSDDATNLRFVAGGSQDREFFEDILDVRYQTDSRWPDQGTPADDYSDHYCLYKDDKPIGSLGVTRALNGPLFLEEFYPADLLDAMPDRIFSAYRFRLLAKFRRTSLLASGKNLALTMMRETWKENLEKGAGIDLINVEPKYIPYYHRLGYIICEGYDFICPVFHEPISVMLLCTDPTRDSVLKDLVQDRDDNVFLDDVLRILSRTKSFVPRRAAL